VIARLRARVRGALGFRASWSESRNRHADSLPGNPRKRKRFGIRISPFLALFGHPCAVDPDPGLAAEAERRGWPILRSAAQ